MNPIFPATKRKKAEKKIAYRSSWGGGEKCLSLHREKKKNPSKMDMVEKRRFGHD